MKFMCPFCNKVHTITSVRNIFCDCSSKAKLYILSGYWLDRENGIRVDLDFVTRYELNKWIAEYLDRNDD